MLRLLRLCATLIGLLLITLFAIGNSRPVEVHFWPTPLTVELPLYSVLLIGLFLGLLLAAAVAVLELLALRVENWRLLRRLRGYELQAKLRESEEDEAALQRIRERSRSAGRALVSGS